ncbi:hypothetical protein LARV_01069 [Longilinea arvoryzae]|uniref:DUF4180 domain-containing protein n=1 Tax=Longilinea arvoryzae TaxID=360412 RepID=A0A0S7BEJ1_9CHLR|nr:DUF4180 domain-containing protein [Longilinea arvoryzae]GAP13316.1 hypothetical protein LARV_01069 [Longilinea arvoryzae]
MNYTLISTGNRSFLACSPDGPDSRVQSERDALDLVAACGENGTENLLLPAGCLNEDFFRLSTGLAGAILLKFSNYHIRCALVLSSEQAHRGRFAELVLEANRRNRELHFFTRSAEAERWLIDEGG